MSTASEMNRVRVISELRQFIKKLLLEPSTIEKSLEIAQRHYGEHDMLGKIAIDLTSETLIKIPDNPEDRTDADLLFLELLKEVVEESQALY